MLPETPRTIFTKLFGGLRFRGGLFALRRQESAFRTEVPTDQILRKLLGRDARGLRGGQLGLRPGPAHELFGSPGEQDDHPELAVDTFGKTLNHLCNSLYGNCLRIRSSRSC